MIDATRTKYQAVLDVQYSIRFNLISTRYYNRLRILIPGASLLAGMSAATPVLQAIPYGVMTAGVLVALGAIANALSGFTEKAIRHDIQRQSYLELLVRSAPLSVEELDAQSNDIDRRWSNEVERLRVVAYNDNVRSAGWDAEVMPESFGHRFMRMLA